MRKEVPFQQIYVHSVHEGRGTFKIETRGHERAEPKGTIVRY